jgi:hypothetical protein
MGSRKFINDEAATRREAFMTRHLTFATRIVALLAGASLAIALSATSAAAQASPAPPVPNAPELEARIDAAVKELMKEPRFRSVPEKQVRDRFEFVAGNVIFATLHEAGHMLIAELALYVLGREEDAADAFAVVAGLKLNNELSDQILMQSARGWFMSDLRNKKQKRKNVFYDEHGLDEQRAYNIVCIMVGSNPEKYGKLADITRMPEERQGTCQGDYSNASWSWDKALAPFIRKDDQPRTPISVTYDDTRKYENIARATRELKMLEVIAGYLSERFVFPRGPVGLEAKECNTPGAFWDLKARKIYVCYELAADFIDMYRAYSAELRKEVQRSRR